MADVKWIKITTDIFDDEKILLIESMPDAYAIITVWFKLLCLAGKQNNSGVFLLNDTIAYTDKMLAVIFRMKETTVTMALQTFEQFGMVKIVDGVITIPNWGKHQNLDSIESKRNYQREYMRNYRERQAQLVGGKANSNTNGNTNSKANVSRAEIEEEKEEDKKEKEKEKPPSYQHIVEMYNSICISLPTVTVLSESRKKAIKARFASGYTDEDFQKLFTMAEGSAFLKGKNARNWQANFDWLIKDANMAKVLDGNYNDSKTTPRQAGPVYNGYSYEDLNALDDLY